MVLQSAREIVKAIGRPKVIQLTGRTTQAVTNWCADNRLPPNTYVVLSAALDEIGKSAPPSLWGMTEQAEAAQ